MAGSQGQKRVRVGWFQCVAAAAVSAVVSSGVAGGDSTANAATGKHSSDSARKHQHQASVTPPSSEPLVVLDLARASTALQWWVPHPSAGEASFDSAVRVGVGPVYSGAEPWPWPVNGVIEWGGVDAPEQQSLYIGLYGYGYSGGTAQCNVSYVTHSRPPPPGGCAFAMLEMLSTDRGETWTRAGLACAYCTMSLSCRTFVVVTRGVLVNTAGCCLRL
jgi:hypothetical protein